MAVEAREDNVATMKFFLIKLVNGKHRGEYFFLAATQEIAVGRAQVSFRREFGVAGILESVKQMTYLDGDEEEGKNV